MASLYGPDDHDDEKDYDWWHDEDYDPVEHDPDLYDIDIVDDEPDCY
jgi:hypothetical protein